MDAEFRTTLLQDGEQCLPRSAAKSVASAAHLFALEVNCNVIPVGELLAHAFKDRLVAAEEFIKSFIREHDAKSKGIVRLVALEDFYVPVRSRFLCQESCIKSAGSATDNTDFHWDSLEQ